MHFYWMVCGWLFVVLLSLGALPLAATGQDASTLRVVVMSEADGTPLQGASVALLDPDDDEMRTAGATNADGFQELRNLTPGQYVLEVSHIGFETYRTTVQLEAGRRTYRVDLSVQAEELDEVEVEEERGAARRQAGLQTIRAAEIDRIPTPGIGGDIAAYLQTLPGVVSVGDRGGQLFIRGGAPSQNRFLMDGLPIIQPFHISSFYSAFPQDLVQDASMYAGGFGAEYSEATSSVLDVRLRPGNMQRYAGNVSTGLHLASITVEGPIERGEQSFLFSSRYSLMDQAAGPLFGQEAPLSFYDITGRYSLQRDNTSCNITATHTHDEGSLSPDRDLVLSWSNTVLGGRCFVYDERLDHAFTIRGGYTEYANTAGTADAPEQEATQWRLYLAFNREQNILGRLFDFGARFTMGRYQAEIDEQFVGLEQLNMLQGMLRAHIATDWEPTSHLSVSPSMGGQITAQSVQPVLEPRLRVSVRPDGTDRQEISMAAGLYRQITEGITDERDAGTVFTIWRPPDTNAPIPQSLHAILGYRQRINSGLEFSLEGYAKRHRNLPVSEWTPEAAPTTRVARAHGTTYGGDARIEFQSGPLYVYLGYGLATVTYEAATDDLGAWVDGTIFSYSPPHDQRHQLNTVLSYEVLGTTTSISWELASGRPYTQVHSFDLALDLPDQRPTENIGTARTIFEEPYGARLPTYHRLDVSAERSFDLTERLSLDAELGAINTYNRSNVFYYDLNTLQREDQSPLLPYLSLRLRAEQ